MNGSPQVPEGGSEDCDLREGEGYFFDQSQGTTQVRRSRDESPLRILAGYRRCIDFDSKNLPGQDFCGLKFDREHAVLVVADGVSQSFFGDIAAKWVGRELVELLWAHRDEPQTCDEVGTALEERRGTLATEVKERKLSDGISPYLERALTEARTEGSQSVFGALVVHRRTKTGTCYVLGDIVALAHVNDETIEILGEKRGRWTSNGLRGGKIVSQQMAGIRSAMLKSDGASSDWGKDDEKVRADAFRAQADKWAENDDVAFAWVSIPHSAEIPSRTPEASDATPGPEAEGASLRRRLDGFSFILGFLVCSTLFGILLIWARLRGGDQSPPKVVLDVTKTEICEDDGGVASADSAAALWARMLQSPGGGD